MRTAPPTRSVVVTNLVLYEIGWFATVLGAAGHQPWLGLLATVPIVAWHLATAPVGWREAALLLAVTVIGGALDALLTARGWLVFHDDGVLPGLQPAWMIVLWTQFATTLNLSLRWLRTRPVVAAALAAVGAPLAYAGGERLGAVTLGAPVPALAALAVGWPVVLVAALALARLLDGFRPNAGSAPAAAAA
jgi:hypothetical protein